MSPDNGKTGCAGAAGNCAVCQGCAAASGCAPEDDRVLFTKEMRRDYTILLPSMLPIHFHFLSEIFNANGYHMVLLENGTHGDAKKVIDVGLKYVHNDTCYPAMLMIGQFIDALNSGEYDVHKTAVLISQTGGGCRASNYLPLLRKALKKAGYGYVPVVSLNFAGLEKNPGFRFTMPMIHATIYAMLYGDLLLTLRDQCRPYETEPGSTQALVDKWIRLIMEDIEGNGIRYGKVKRNYRLILEDFAALPRTHDKKPLVGIVGEIFVKFSPLGNNALEAFLNAEGAETTMGGLCDFLLYVISNMQMDRKIYGTGRFRAFVAGRIARFFIRRQDDMIRAIREHGVFRAPARFEDTCRAAADYIGYGTKMGEGWLLPAEMAELLHSGVENIVVVQPFGCLPNHIIGKGMMKPMKEKNPGANIIAIDYDAGASKINQENRLKLMLANARASQGRAEQNAQE